MDKKNNLTKESHQTPKSCVSDQKIDFSKAQEFFHKILRSDFEYKKTLEKTKSSELCINCEVFD